MKISWGINLFGQSKILFFKITQIPQDNKIIMKQKMCNYAIITCIKSKGVLCGLKHLKHFDMTFIKMLSW